MNKATLQKVVNALPDEFTIDELFSRVDFVQKIEEGLKSLREEGGIPQDEVKRELEAHIRNHGESRSKLSTL